MDKFQNIFGTPASAEKKTASIQRKIVGNSGMEPLGVDTKLSEALRKYQKHDGENVAQTSCKLPKQLGNSGSQMAKLPPSIASILASAQLTSPQAIEAWCEAKIQEKSTSNKQARQKKGLGPFCSLMQSATNSSCITARSRTSKNSSTSQGRELKSFASRLYKTSVSKCPEISDEGIDLFKLNIIGDGRCLFRSVAILLFRSYQVFTVSATQERNLADALRCETVKELHAHRELLEDCFVIEGDFSEYVDDMSQPTTFAGEPELFMLSKLTESPVFVYVSMMNYEDYKRIQTYGPHFTRDPLRLLYSERTQHYDALVSFRKSETIFGRLG